MTLWNVRRRIGDGGDLRLANSDWRFAIGEMKSRQAGRA